MASPIIENALGPIAENLSKKLRPPPSLLLLLLPLLLEDWKPPVGTGDMIVKVGVEGGVVVGGVLGFTGRGGMVGGTPEVGIDNLRCLTRLIRS